MDRKERMSAAILSLRKGPSGKRFSINRRQYIAIAVLAGRRGPGFGLKSIQGLSPKEAYYKFLDTLDQEGRIAVSLLAMGKGRDGKALKLRVLNEDGPKGLPELFEEIRLSEARLRIKDYKAGIVTRRAFRLETEIRVGDYLFVELERIYTGKEPVAKEKNITETGQKDEDVRKIFFRALLFELGIRLSDKEIDDLFDEIFEKERMVKYIDAHWSHAYLGLESEVETLKIHLVFSERPEKIKNGKEIKDTSVVIKANWIYSPKNAEIPSAAGASFNEQLTKNLHKAFPVEDFMDFPEEIVKLLKGGK